MRTRRAAHHRPEDVVEYARRDVHRRADYRRKSPNSRTPTRNAGVVSSGAAERIRTSGTIGSPAPTTPRKALHPLLQYHILVFIVAFTAVLGRVMTIEAPSIVFWRTGIAAVAMALCLALTAPRLLRLSTRTAIEALGVGTLIGAHWVCFFWSISLSNISIALAGFATISLFTAITEPLIERRPGRGSEILCGVIVIVGILLIAGLETEHLAGFLVSLVGAVLAAIFPVLNRAFVARGESSRSLLLYEMAGACAMAAATIPLIAPGRFEFPASGDWLPLLALALLCTLVAHTWNIHLLKRLTAYTANLAMNFEPVWGILLGALLFHEHEDLHPGFYLGTALIIVANFLDPCLRRWTRRARSAREAP